MTTENQNHGERTIEANRLPRTTRRALGYHREDGVGVCTTARNTENTDPTSVSEVCALVAATAFVLAGVALSTIPIAML